MSRYTVILSDDNKALFETLTEIAYEEGVDLICCQDWEAAKVKLMDDFDGYHAIILDGKGKINDSAKDGDPKHLSNAVKWLAEQSAKRKYIPAVVFTGFFEAITEFQEANEQILRIFSKGENTNSSFKEVLSFLKKAIANLPEQKFRISFPDVYIFSEKHFSNDNRTLIREVFNLVHNKSDDFIWKKNTFDALRRLNEALIDTIPTSYYSSPYSIKDYVDKIKRESSIKANAGNRTLSFIDFFHDNEIPVPDPIYFTIRSIYDTASKKYVHNESEESDYTPSTEMIAGLVYSHFGCYHWFNSIIKN